MNLDSGYSGIRVTVLGASGFIGRWVASRLSAAGAELTSVVRDPARFAAVRERWGIGGEVVGADVRLAGAAAAVLRGSRPSIVFNLIGYGVDRQEQDQSEAWTINGLLPGRLVEAVASIPVQPGWQGRRLVHVGSALEYGTEAGSLDEEGPATPTTLYGRSKLRGTLGLRRIARRLGVDAVTARLFTVYGPGEHAGRLLPTVLAAAQHDEPVELSAGLHHRDFAWVGDVAVALLGIGGRSGLPGETINVATGKLVSVREFTERAARTLGIHPSRLRFGTRPTRPEEMKHEPVTIARLRRLLGWVPATSIEEGVLQARAFQRAG